MSIFDHSKELKRVRRKLDTYTEKTWDAERRMELIEQRLKETGLPEFQTHEDLAKKVRDKV